MYIRLLLVMKFLLEGEVYLITMEVNNTAHLVNIFDFISVGKIRRCWMRDNLSDTGLKMLEAVKKELDPQNTFRYTWSPMHMCLDLPPFLYHCFMI